MTASSVQEIIDLIVNEAQLLDDWRLDEWLQLYRGDGIYWIPIDESGDPRFTPSIAYDDSVIRKMRVHQLVRERGLGAATPHHTVRYVTNITVKPVSEIEATARSNLLVAELRGGDWHQHGLGQQRLFAGTCHFRCLKDGGQWKIAEKKILLINRNGALEGLSFIL